METQWTNNKPDFKEQCLCLTAVNIRGEWNYDVYEIKKVNHGDGWYMGWFTSDGEEYGDLSDMKADKYLTMPLLPQVNTIRTPKPPQP